MIRLDEHALGLTTDRQRHINQVLQDYDPNLTLRRIPDSDPIMPWARQQNPPHLYGVWEATVDRRKAEAISNWVFTVAEISIDERILARIFENDMTRSGADERMAKLVAHNKSKEVLAQRAMMDKLEEKRDEMLTIGKLAREKSTFRHKINGEDMIVGDTLRSARTHV